MAITHRITEQILLRTKLSIGSASYQSVVNIDLSPDDIQSPCQPKEHRMDWTNTIAEFLNASGVQVAFGALSAILGGLLGHIFTLRKEREFIQRQENREDYNTLATLSQRFFEQMNTRLNSIRSFLLWKDTDDTRYYDQYTSMRSRSIHENECTDVQLEALTILRRNSLLEHVQRFTRHAEALNEFMLTLAALDEPTKLVDTKTYFSKVEEFHDKLVGDYGTLMHHMALSLANRKHPDQ